MAKQVITISNEKISYILYSSDGKVTTTQQKSITQEQYAMLLKKFNDNKFLELKDKYAPPEVTVADVGDARIIVTFNDTIKSVTLEPYFLEYYPDNVVNVVEELQSYINTIYDLPVNELKSLAEDWIRNAPTYKYDGSELEFEELIQLETYPVSYVLKYSFKSGGYGDRSKIAGIQAITEHKILITINRGKIVNAVIDDKWDEINQKNYEAALMFQPLQCAKTPWRKWYDAGNIQFAKAPAEEELVIAYYGQVHDVNIQSFKFVNSNNLVAALCGNPESYYFTIMINAADKEKMLKLYWKEIEE